MDTIPMWVSATVLALSYILIFTEIMHRTNAAIIGAVSMVSMGLGLGFYSQEKAILAIDANTLLLLAGMMIMVSMLRNTGAFEYLAIVIARSAHNNPVRLLLYLSIAVSLISMVLDNVTTVIVFAPLTILITRILQLNPVPFLVAEAMLSNIGGIATLVGDPPNIMIGSAANISFTEFIIHMGPPVAVVWLFSIAFLIIYFRQDLVSDISVNKEQYLVAKHAITDKKGLIKTLFSLFVIIILFFIHHHFHLYPAFVAFLGVAIALLLMTPQPDSLLKEIDWSVLFFFAGLFVIVGGVEASGLLAVIGDNLAHMSENPEHLLLTGLALMWAAAFISAIVDNIPFTVTMIPILLGLQIQGIEVSALWWALALGVGLGGNGTHIGATANIIALTALEKSGIDDNKMTPLEWMKAGLPVMFTGLCVASVVYWLFFDHFVHRSGLN